jgi:hypothetical protein
MSGGHPFMSPKRFVKELGIKAIDAPDGSRLEPLSGGISVGTPDVGDGLMTVTVRYAWFAPKPKPANTEQAGGYVVPEELADAVRTGLEIVGQPVTVNLKPRLSDWIDGSVKPTIVGVYQRRYGSTSVHYCMWNGRYWLFPTDNIATAAHAARGNPGSNASFEQALPWRGLAEDPSRGLGHAS